MRFVDDRSFCPESIGYYPWQKYENNCYHLFGIDATSWSYKDERTFEEASQFCKSKGGDLMSIGSQAEEDTVLPLVVPQSYLTKSFWIGLRRKVDAFGDEYPKDYEWMDGTQSDFQHFAGKIFLFYIALNSAYMVFKFASNKFL